MKGPRLPALNITSFDIDDYLVNYVDAMTGFIVNGTLPVNADHYLHLPDWRIRVHRRAPRSQVYLGVAEKPAAFSAAAKYCLGLNGNYHYLALRRTMG
ncbi:hypothetical protein EDD37DRAFT_465832 [Exophiala viscosa]|uniref:Uncharacterized protein n=1 Tax=Exophiala viscosa TaxID=2486360 RepID=A0AAN6DS23_9EURO|nr:hypothetical protein EDD36DRAFT_267074 [Exophiala viscosa]KAI1623351.1 hypothetical protein EDD37DRAFT_465832 [Exophiala viscosa]